MRRLAPFLLAGFCLGACLQRGPSLGGKLCDPKKSECGSGFACVDKSATAEPLALPAPGGVCEVSPLDCDPHLFDCPGDGGFWICSKQSGAPTCYATGDADLAGSLCMVDRGQCRTYGVFAWSPDDGGRCITPPGNPKARAGSECWDAGGAGPFCPCDHQDEDCDGVADDFDPGVASQGLDPSVSIPSGQGCAVGDTWVLEPGGTPMAPADGGPSVDSCASLSLGHGYSISRVEAYTTADVAANTCSNAAAGTATSLVLFGALDGGYNMLGTATVSSHTARFDLAPQPLRELLICLPSGGAAPFGISGVGITRALGGPSQCDLF